jgi:hypothetical protein
MSLKEYSFREKLMSSTLYINTFENLLRLMMSDPRWQQQFDSFLSKKLETMTNAEFYLKMLNYYRYFCQVISEPELRTALSNCLNTIESLIKASQQRVLEKSRRTQSRAQQPYVVTFTFNL